MEWTLVAPVIAALVSGAAAIYAARSANKARASEVEASRLRELEQRLSSKKIEIYESILTTLGNVLTRSNCVRLRIESSRIKIL